MTSRQPALFAKKTPSLDGFRTLQVVIPASELTQSGIQRVLEDQVNRLVGSLLDDAIIEGVRSWSQVDPSGRSSDRNDRNGSEKSIGSERFLDVTRATSGLTATLRYEPILWKPTVGEILTGRVTLAQHYGILVQILYGIKVLIPLEKIPLARLAPDGSGELLTPGYVYSDLGLYTHSETGHLIAKDVHLDVQIESIMRDNKREIQCVGLLAEVGGGYGT